MKLKKVIVSMAIIIILVFIPTVALADLPAYSYNTVNVVISYVMEIASIILGIAYLIISIIYLIKTKEQKTIIQQMRVLIIWLIITVIVIIALRYFAPIVKEMGKTTIPKVRFKSKNGQIIVD